MNSIHPTAAIAPHVRLGRDVKIGPFCVVEERVEIGPGTRLESHAVIKSGTRLGSNNFVGESTVLGAAPQHARCPANIGRLEIGSGNTFREYVTVHRALNSVAITEIGDGNLLMVNSHVGHDCVVGEFVHISPGAHVAGTVSIGNRSWLGIGAAVREGVSIGPDCVVGAGAAVVSNIASGLSGASGGEFGSRAAISPGFTCARTGRSRKPSR